jgi:hypothetical protein
MCLNYPGIKTKKKVINFGLHLIFEKVNIMNRKLIIALMVFGLAPTISFAVGEMKPMTDDEIRVDILNGFLKSFEGECPCPTSVDKQGKTCGDDSAYFKTRGKVICFKRDISDADVNAYRQKYSIIDPKSDPYKTIATPQPAK